LNIDADTMAATRGPPGTDVRLLDPKQVFGWDIEFNFGRRRVGGFSTPLYRWP
jgi:hypothetical protein